MSATTPTTATTTTVMIKVAKPPTQWRIQAMVPMMADNTRAKKNRPTTAPPNPMLYRMPYFLAPHLQSTPSLEVVSGAMGVVVAPGSNLALGHSGGAQPQ
jgi:hypothetical protein